MNDTAQPSKRRRKIILWLCLIIAVGAIGASQWPKLRKKLAHEYGKFPSPNGVEMVIYEYPHLPWESERKGFMRINGGTESVPDTEIIDVVSQSTLPGFVPAEKKP